MSANNNDLCAETVNDLFVGTVYILGHSQAEIRRLIKQAAILRTTTERLLRSAGIERGMRVLDLGCGAGDVAMLAGELVGASGSVVGIDRNAQVLVVARERAQAAGFLHVAFTEASVDTFADPAPFDLVIARYVLVYQVDPVAFLHAAARFAGCGGILALHEPILDRPLHSLPHVPLWQQTADRMLMTLRAGTPSWDAAGRLIEHFSRAGLPQPTLSSETVVGGGVDAPHYAWLADAVRTLLPQMIQTGVATAETVAIETLESRLQSAVVEARSQVEGMAQVCAWTRVCPIRHACEAAESNTRSQTGDKHGRENRTTASHHRQARTGAVDQALRPRHESTAHHRSRRRRHLGHYGVAQTR